MGECACKCQENFTEWDISFYIYVEHKLIWSAVQIHISLSKVQIVIEYLSFTLGKKYE